MNRSFLLGALLVLIPLGCGGSGTGATTGGGSSQTLTVLLGSDSNPDLQQAVLGVEKVEISSDGSTWTTLGSPRSTGDLMGLQGGHEVTLLSNASVSRAGSYVFRLTWATTNYANGAMQAAYVVPAGSAVGYQMTMPVSTVFSGAVTVPSNGSATALLMVDSADAIQAFQGTSLTFAFNPAPTAFDLSATASITGRLSIGGTAQQGLEAFAEVVDGAGNPYILRRALSDASGNYVLDGLPSQIGGLSPVILVVAMPCSATGSFAAQGAPPVNVTAPGNYAGADIDFSSSLTSPGNLALKVTPQTPSGSVTVADLRQNVAFGLSSAYVIVRSQNMITSAASDNYTFSNLPSVYFGVNATRYSSAPPATVSSPSQVLVAAGTTTSVTLGF
ncbi:MAG TPA: hypothetical protein VJ600_05795 [Holophagaceae bacterium]|nr:hypothetical protein [Holophagaceae bacterium]